MRTDTLKRRSLLSILGIGATATTIGVSTSAATHSTLQFDTTQNSVQYDWNDGTKQGWSKIEVEDGQKYKYGFSSHVYEFNVISNDPIEGEYSPQIECLNDRIYVQSPDLEATLGDTVQSVSATFRLTGDLDASDSNNNQFRVNDATGARNGSVRFNHEEMALKWRGGETEQLQPFKEGVEYDITITTETDDSFTVSVNGTTYSGLEPYEGQQASIHTVEMRSVNSGGIGPSRYDDSIYFTWDNFEATSENSENQDPDDGDQIPELYEDFEQGLGDWETNGDVSIQEGGVVTDSVAKITDSEDGDGSSGRIHWQRIGEVSTHDEFELRGVYQAVTSARYNYRFGIDGEDRHLLMIDPESDAIGFGNIPYRNVTGDTIDSAFIGAWVRFRMYFDGTGTVRAKVWEYNQSEPDEWQISTEFEQDTGTIIAGSGQNQHGRELLVDELEVVNVQDDDDDLEEVTIEPVESIGTVFDPVPVAVEVSPSTAVDQVVVEASGPGDTEEFGPREVELEKNDDGRFEGELTPYAAVGTFDATMTLTVSDNTKLSIDETVVVRPKAFTTEEYLGYQLGRGFAEDSDLELLAETIIEEGIDQTLETGTEAAVQALAQKAGLGSAQTAAAAAIAGKAVGLALTIGGFVPGAGVPTATTAFAYSEAETEDEALSMTDSLTVSAGNDVLPAFEVTQGTTIDESLSYAVENTTTGTTVTREVPFGEAHRPEIGHKALVLPFDELEFPADDDIAGEYELIPSYGGGSSSATITIEETEKGTSDTATTDTEFEDMVEDIPGFGIGSALAGLGGAGYVIKRRLDSEEE